jgi:hypothetical protein
MPKWFKRVMSTEPVMIQYINPRGFGRNIEYIALDDSPNIRSIQVEHWGKINLNRLNKLNNIGKSIITDVGGGKSLLRLPTWLPDLPDYLKTLTGYTLFDSSDVAQILNVFRELDDIDDETFNEILGLAFPYNPELDVAKVGTLLDKENPTQKDIETAIEIAFNAQTKGHFDLIWELAKELKTGSVTHEVIVNLFEKISPKNPHYKDANFELFGLITPHSSNLSEEEKQSLLEKKLRVAIRSEKEDLIHHAFNELSDAAMGQSISSLKGDEDTLLYLAKEMRKLRQEIKKLTDYKVRTETEKASESRSTAGMWKKTDSSQEGEPDNNTPSLFQTKK